MTQYHTSDATSLPPWRQSDLARSSGARAWRPRAILMENVPDIGTNEDGIILRSVFCRMEQLGYSVDCRSYFARELWVAQHRQRLFVAGFRAGARLLDWPVPRPPQKQPGLRAAISDLPALQGGWDEPTPPYARSSKAAQRRNARWRTIRPCDTRRQKG